MAERGRGHEATRERERAAKRRPGEHPAGPLILIGGGATANGRALGAFLEIAEARAGGPIVGLTTASGDPSGSAAAWRRDFSTAGVDDVEIPIVERREQAGDARVAAKLREARGIFLGGGDQIKLIATLGGTAVGAAIRDACMGGTPVCGTSAGAAALTKTTLANGEVDLRTGQLIEMYIGPGLGLLGFHTMIDTHFAERRRLHRLFVAVAGYPELMGLGIDEDTALVVRGHLGEVVGKGGVTFVDGRDVHYDNASEVRRNPGAQLTLSYLRVGIVGDGHVLNLRERELEEVVRSRLGVEEESSVSAS